MNKKQLKSLQEKVESLEKTLQFYKTRCENLEQAYDTLCHAVKDAQRQRFGSKSEKYHDSDNPQRELFGEKKLDALSESPSSDVEDSSDDVISINAYKRKKQKSKGFPKHLPRREEIIEAKDKRCHCGCAKDVIRYETKERLNYIPATWEVIIEKREVVACKKGCKGSMHVAKSPKRILPKVEVTESLLAHIVVSKFDDRQPLYHLQKKFESRFDILLGRHQMARWVIALSKAVQPIINLMKDTVLDYDVASVDPTSLQVLDEPGRPPTTSSYLYCVRGGPPDKRVVIYDYNPTSHKDFLQGWFEGFEGYLHCDGQNIFDVFERHDAIKLVYCHAHARRYFEKIAKHIKTQKGLAHQVMRFYKRVYRIENQLKHTDASPDKVKAYRLEHLKDLFEQHFKWLEAYAPTVLPKSSLGVAFEYSLKRKEGLMRCFEDGRLALDNNATEQSIKPVVMSRKNFLFSHSVDGAHAIANHMSLIRSAKLHGLDPYFYLQTLFLNIPHCASVSDFESLLPWHCQMNKSEGNILKIA